MKFRSIPIFTIVILLFLSCSRRDLIEIESGSDHQQKAWNAYDRKNFANALIEFERAVNLDDQLDDAHNGLGWTKLSISKNSAIGPQMIADAQNSFQKAIVINPENSDAWIGLANTLFLRRHGDVDFQNAIRAIDNSLQTDRAFMFRHDYNSIADLYALQALSYFYIEDWKKVKQLNQKIKKLEPQNSIADQLDQLID